MMLKRETVYDLENTYDQIADEDEDVVEKIFTQLDAMHGEVIRQLHYQPDDIDDKLVEHFTQAALAKQISAKWAKGYLFYKYFDE